MKILNVSAQKPDSTGSGIYLSKTTQCMIDEGIEVAVVCGVDDGDSLDGVPEDATVYPVRFNTPSLPFDVCGMSDNMPYPATRYRDMTPEMTEAFKDAFRKVLREAILSEKPDAIVSHHLYLVTALVREVVDEIAAECASGDMPLVQAPKVYGLSHSTDLRQLRQHGLERAFILEEIPRLDGIFSLHEDQKEDVVELFGIDPGLVTVIGVGYDDEAFNCRGRADTKGDPIRLLYAGKISFPKGVFRLMDAVGILQRKGFRVELTLAGGHSNREQYDEIVAKADLLDPRPTFLGQVPPSRLAELYRESDIFVLPSFFEGLPLVVLEALACGCRVVVTDLPGIRRFFDAELPEAPIYYVAPPRMTDVDRPIDDDLPAFSENLVKAIVAASNDCTAGFDASSLSWAGITCRMLDAVSKGA